MYDDYDASVARERPARREPPMRQARDRRRVVEPDDDYEDDDYEENYMHDRPDRHDGRFPLGMTQVCMFDQLAETVRLHRTSTSGKCCRASHRSSDSF